MEAAVMAIEVNNIYKMDCLKGLSDIKPGTVDLAFADPPFNIGYDYDTYNDHQDAEAYLDWSRKWMEAVVKTLKSTGTFWLAIGDEYAAELKVIAQRDLGLTCRNWVIWYYTFGVHCTKKFSRSHAHLFYFVKDPKDFTFNDMEIRVPSARQLVYADRRADSNGRVPDDTWILRPQDLPEGFESDGDVWYFPRVCGTFKERKGWHGCQMPEQLLGRIIRACSNAGELVLDPFGGSGTTLAVAKKLGRPWLGFEISKEYVARIKKRLKTIDVGDPLDGTKQPLESVPPTPNSIKSLKRIKQHCNPTNSSTKLTRFPDRLHLKNKSANYDSAIVKAYKVACQGFSVDRLIAEPALNKDFETNCRELGIPGCITEWNRHLLGLRKRGKLILNSPTKRTVIPSTVINEICYASEIAYSLLSLKYNASLDDILCNPNYANEFDQIARKLAPNRTPFLYRWSALYLRKRACIMRKYASKSLIYVKQMKLDQRTKPLDRLKAPSLAGVYLLKSGSESIYVGETECLESRIKQQTNRTAIQVIGIKQSDARVVVWPLDVQRSVRLGIQSHIMNHVSITISNLQHEN
jgi:site-specific DNA-methyltransferase (adenine-specific)